MLNWGTQVPFFSNHRSKPCDMIIYVNIFRSYIKAALELHKFPCISAQIMGPVPTSNTLYCTITGGPGKAPNLSAGEIELRMD